VAVSRARDQLWVVHSFDPALHLKVTDLRFKLLQHVKDPLASLRAFNQEAGKTESPFEREVLKRLTDAGFKVKTQWQVGYFRIDMVVEGGGKRLAVECDGDRYHPMEKLAEDMDRQAILERLGWQFVRIRGSAFYRDKELSMRPVFTRLAELEITQEENTDEQPVSDMTLVHELDDLIDQGINIKEVQEHEALISDELDSISGGGDQGEFGGFATNPADFDHGQVESLLGSLGGIAPLDDFLRQFAKAKGYQRLGSSVRKELESELARLSRAGKITIESGVIRLI
jgi:very-short-patch-repair endonuclease